MLPLLLLSLLQESSLYGSEIMKLIDNMSHGEWCSGPAAARRIYTLTDAGRREYPATRERLLDELRSAHAVIDQHLKALETMVSGERIDHEHNHS
ncbi:hypothetical protein ACFL6M_01230 [Candidatus Eisenbacteria bacterium]|uniref:Transcription regulator PadR N-terminal domain-containing protein n=1 Tax=Eiseniibacteriota bacterium TaxID=2212470 RepID=A0ABV6YIN2_UNCEI